MSFNDHTYNICLCLKQSSTNHSTNMDTCKCMQNTCICTYTWDTHNADTYLCKELSGFISLNYSNATGRCSRNQKQQTGAAHGSWWLINGWVWLMVDTCWYRLMTSCYQALSIAEIDETRLLGWWWCPELPLLAECLVLGGGPTYGQPVRAKPGIPQHDKS